MNLLLSCVISFIIGILLVWLFIFIHWLYQRITLNFKLLSKRIYDDKILYTIRHGLTERCIVCKKDDKEYCVGNKVKIINDNGYKGYVIL